MHPLARERASGVGGDYLPDTMPSSGEVGVRKVINRWSDGSRLCFHGFTIRKEVVQISSKTFGTLEVASR